jgi:hypothetical protein
MNHKKSERGQAIIFIVLGFIVILGFVGLAIDGGMVYSDRRHAQNAADASALAAAGRAAHYLENVSNQLQYVNWVCGNAHVAQAANDGVAAAINRALTNEFTIDNDPSDFNGVSWRCESFNYGPFTDHYIDFTVWITTVTPANFSQFLFKAPLESRVQAVARLRPRMSLAFGHAVVATNQAECSGNSNGVILSGDSVTLINGGGVYSNGCLKGNGNSFGVVVDNGNVVYTSEAQGNFSGVSPYPVQASLPIPDYALALTPPDCTGAHVMDSIVQTSNNASTNLEPGLYCLTSHSTALRVLGGDFIGENVTFYIPFGSVDISGNANVHLFAPQSHDYAPAIKGVLFYLPPSNHSTVSLQGTSDSTFLGTVYAPGGDVVLTGTNGTHPTFNTQIIGNNVDISGTVDIDINFSQANNVKKPTSIDMNK